jgi:hypothetical protein
LHQRNRRFAGSIEETVKARAGAKNRPKTRTSQSNRKDYRNIPGRTSNKNDPKMPKEKEEGFRFRIDNAYKVQVITVTGVKLAIGSTDT